MLVYPAQGEGIVALDLATGDRRTLVAGDDLAWPALDRKGTRLVYTATRDGKRMIRRFSPADGSDHELCDGSSMRDTWRVARPAFSPAGDKVAFVSRDVFGSVRLMLALPSGVCLRAADAAPAGAWAPGDDRLLVTDGAAVAAQTIVNPLEPWQRPPGGLPPLYRLDGGGIAALAVNRAMDRYAIATANEVRIVPFAGGAASRSVRLAELFDREPAPRPVPEALAFSPDGEFLALSCGPDDGPRLFLLCAERRCEGRAAAPWKLDPPPSAPGVAWVPNVL
ncbi:MAG: hypothetical protein M5R36_03695 [Deltaproteobacteria bacterium]|nr:hypothetical protein [Deltaproteobacteria bacterium]